MKKSVFTGIFVTAAAIILAGCSNSGGGGDQARNTQATEASEEVTETTTTESTTESTTAATTAATESTTESQASYTAAIIFYPVFQPNNAIKQKSVRINGAIDENKIMQALQDEGVLDTSCKILSYEKSGDTIKVDFNSDCGVYLMRMAPEEANLRAKSVAMTFCRNLGASQFYFYTNGHALETGNKTYDEPIGVN